MSNAHKLSLDQSRFLSPAFAVVLDLTRFSAALVVVAAHVAQDGLYTGVGAMPMWAGHAAVLAFFVISGAVIAETANRPGQTLHALALARLSRLYSVVVPAIALSYLLSWSVASQIGGPTVDIVERAANFWTPISSLFFLNESWGNSAQLPWNAPYWSLCYEAWYYALLAAAVFLNGRKRLAAVAVVLIIAGPRILLLLPVWMLGVWLTNTRVHPRLNAPAAVAVIALCAVGFVWVCSDFVADGVLAILRENIPGWWRLGFSSYAVTDFVGGVWVTMMFIGARALTDRARPALSAIAPAARTLASFSFSLYLFHRPLTKALSAYGASAGTSLIAYIALLIAIVATCYLLSRYTERKRSSVQSILERLFFVIKQRLLPST